MADVADTTSTDQGAPVTDSPATHGEVAPEAENVQEEQHLDAAMDDVDLNSPRRSEDNRMSPGRGGLQGSASDSRLDSQSKFSLPDTEVQSKNTVPYSVRLQSFASWGITKVKCARQSMNERLGKVTRTVDSQMDERIESLREAQRIYMQIMNLAKKLSMQLKAFLETQRQLGDIFSEYGVRVVETDLQTELLRGGQVQRTVARNGEGLVAALDHFVNSINTLISKTMEDTFGKVREYEATRVQYDAFRVDVEQLQTFCDANPANTTKQTKLESALVLFEAQKSNFTVVRNELSVKLKFLDENKVAVMQKQLQLLHNATSGFFTGNVDLLERCLKSYHIRRLDLSNSLPTQSEVKAVLQEISMGASTGSAASTPCGDE